MNPQPVPKDQARKIASRWGAVLDLAGAFSLMGFLASFAFVGLTILQAVQTKTYGEATNALVGAGLFSIAMIGVAKEQREKWQKYADQGTAEIRFG